MPSPYRRWLQTGALFATTVLADFFTKYWANTHLSYHSPQDFIPGLLRLTLTRNTGGAFGIGKENAALMAFLASGIFLSLLFWLVKKERSANPPSNWERNGLALILGGALGNIIDRFFHGEVTDFLEFTFISFPVFNLADVMIDVGAAFVIIATLKSKPANEPPANSND